MPDVANGHCDIGAVKDTRRLRALCTITLMAVLALSGGCIRRSRPVPPEDIEFAQRYLALFQSRSFPAIEMGMDPSIRDAQVRVRLMQMASVFPREAPSAVRLVFSQLTKSGDSTSSSLSFQFEYPNRWLRADVVVARTGQAPVVSGVHIQPLKEPLERTNRITLEGKGAAHYAAAAASLLVLLFVLSTFVLAIRTPIGGVRWAWAAVTLVGVVEAVFNWTTGQLSFVPMSTQLLSTGFSRTSPYAPLFITVSIPVGAIVFLVQRRDLLRRQADGDDSDDLDAPPGGAGAAPGGRGPASFEPREGAVAAAREDVEARGSGAIPSPRDRPDDH